MQQLYRQAAPLSPYAAVRSLTQHSGHSCELALSCQASSWVVQNCKECSGTVRYQSAWLAVPCQFPNHSHGVLSRLAKVLTRKAVIWEAHSSPGAEHRGSTRVTWAASIPSQATTRKSLMTLPMLGQCMTLSCACSKRLDQL